MLEHDLPFRLFANCVPVRGARRSTICDLQRGRIHLVPNGLHEVVTARRDLTLRQLKELYGEEEHGTLEEYFELLLARELGFWCEDPEAFPDLDPAWDAPSRVTNAIVDVGAHSRHDFASLIAQLDGLGCRMLQLRFFAACPLERLEAVLETARGSRLRSIEILLPHDPAWQPD